MNVLMLNKGIYPDACTVSADWETFYEALLQLEGSFRSALDMGTADFVLLRMSFGLHPIYLLA